MKYAVIQNNYAIFGIGETADEAKKNAAEWIDGEPEWGENDGDFSVVECTDALAEQVNSNGGAIAWGELDDGTICTVEEEDE